MRSSSMLFLTQSSGSFQIVFISFSVSLNTIFVLLLFLLLLHFLICFVFFYVQCLAKKLVFLAIPYVNEVTLRPTLKMLLASWFLVCFFKRFRCLNAENLGSVGHLAAKLPAIKLSEWLDRDRGFEPEQTGWLGPGPAGRLFLETSNFDS